MVGRVMGAVEMTLRARTSPAVPTGRESRGWEDEKTAGAGRGAGRKWSCAGAAGQ